MCSVLPYLGESSEHNLINDILIIDGVGEYATHSTCTKDNNNSIISCARSIFPNSVGLFYSAITAYLGFEVNDAEFKVMGLAAYGHPCLKSEMSKMIKVNDDQEIILDTDFFDFGPNAIYPFTPKFIDKLGPPAPPSANYAEDFKDIDYVSSRPDLTRYANIAASAQECIKDVVVNLFQNRDNFSPKVAYSGGVALNTKINQTLLYLGNKLVICPDPGDGGSSLGAVVGLSLDEKKDYPKLNTAYLGYEINDTTLDKAIDEFDGRIETVRWRDFSDLCEYVSDVLDRGSVVGWVQGRAEFGPRALGNRSILANPRNPEAQYYVNKSVKFREPFRPFAPSILMESLDKLFDLPDDFFLYSNHPLYFMLSTLKAKDVAYNLIPACIHVDGTSRVHVVSIENNYKYYQLIKSFYNKTNVPGLLNTSFNLRGEPMVNTEYDAINTFLRSGLDELVINDRVIKRTI